MANCITCGRALPAFTFGAQSNVCSTCRAGAIDAPAGYPGQPAERSLAAPGKAPVTRVLVGINVAVFLAMAFSGVSLSEPTIGQLITWGANYGPLSLGTQ